MDFSLKMLSILHLDGFLTDGVFDTEFDNDNVQLHTEKLEHCI